MWTPLLLTLLGSLRWTALADPPGQDEPCTPDKLPYGPSFVVPLELAQGVTLGRGDPAPYAASARLYPTYILDRQRQLRVAAAAGFALVNPGLEALIGGRLSKSVFEVNAGPIRGVGAHLGIEGLYGTSDRALLGAALIFDAGGAFQATIRADQDVTNHATLLELGLGIQVYTGPTPVKRTPLPQTPTTYLGRVRQAMARGVKAAIGAARTESVVACTELVSSARRFFGNPSPAVTTVAAFRQALTDGGLARIEGRMREPPPRPPDVTEIDVVGALYRGIADGIERPGGQ
jgi:hypothetical protein